jgi:UDP-2,3-diacylglucosamine pyrophosphatase LpxH
MPSPVRFHFRSLWLSDVHLGTTVARAAELLDFLDTVTAENIYLTGDIIDIERIRAKPAFPALHRDVVTRLIRLAAARSRVVYVPGNHDREMREYAGHSICGIEVRQETEHLTAAGERLLVIHGDCLDPAVRRGTNLEQFGAAAYRWLVEADVTINRLRQRLGRDELPIATRIKLRLKSAHEYIARFEEAAARYALKRGFDGIVCGHIHRPAIRDIAGVRYANDGDWVEHRTAVAEDWDGQLHLLCWQRGELIIEERNHEKNLAA